MSQEKQVQTRQAVVLLAVLYVVFLGSMVYAAGALPEQVATHFGWGGEANGWMSKGGDLFFMALVGFGLPLFIIGACYSTRFMPKSLVNLPHREYWLAPEQRKQTAQDVGQRSIWMACMMVAFLTVLHLLVVAANRQSSPRLSNSAMFTLTGCFLAGTGVWVWGLYRHFNQLPNVQAR